MKTKIIKNYANTILPHPNFFFQVFINNLFHCYYKKFSFAGKKKLFWESQYENIKVDSYSFRKFCALNTIWLIILN